tara:strand:+ start:24 stop:533 length:510 start_codon:yes stop_codon:yes gene_type:complete
MSSFTGTLVGELLHSLKNNESEEKIVSIINRLEQLEKNADKKVFEAETFERVQKYEMMNDNLILDGRRFKTKIVKVKTGQKTCANILVPVEQRTCCIDEKNYSGNCCKDKPCDICPYGKGKGIPASSDNEDLVIEDGVAINIGKTTSKPCEGCDCGKADNITLDIEDMA